MKLISLVAAALLCSGAMAKSLGNDYLVKISPEMMSTTVQALQARLPKGSVVEDLGGQGWVRVKLPQDAATVMSTNTLLNMPGVIVAGQNRIITLNATWKVTDPAKRAALKKIFD